MTNQTLAPVDRITGLILTLREQRVIIDADLARLYGISTKAFNQAVKRNRDRFPADFMFQITAEEYETMMSHAMRSQFVTASKRNIRYLPYAFTEHGAVMAATILNSPKAIEVSVYVVRAFIQQRAMLAAHADLSLQLARLEKKLLAGLQIIREHDDTLAAHESQIEALIEAIHEIRTPSTTPRRSIGFKTREK